jgi:hypothetical protein
MESTFIVTISHEGTSPAFSKDDVRQALEFIASSELTTELMESLSIEVN